MNTERQKRWRRGIAVAVAVCCLLLGGRIFAWYSAKRFGEANVAALSFISPSEFGNTDGMEEFHAAPEIDAYARRVGMLSFLAPDHHRSLTEFKSGLIYLSRQHSLPQAERFLNPPVFRNVILDSSDASDDGVFRALDRLLVSYREAL